MLEYGWLVNQQRLRPRRAKRVEPQLAGVGPREH
jgi:hypothetical protein